MLQAIEFNRIQRDFLCTAGLLAQCVGVEWYTYAGLAVHLYDQVAIGYDRIGIG